MKSSPLPLSFVNSNHCFAISQSHGICDSSKQEKQKTVPHLHFISLAILSCTLIDILHLGFGHDFISLLVTVKFLTTLFAKNSLHFFFCITFFENCLC